MGAATRAAVTAGGAAAVAVAGYLSVDALTGLLLVLGALFAVGWPRLVALPTHGGASAVIAGVAVVALLAGRLSTLDALALVMGLAVVAAFVHQMLRRDGRPRLVESVSGVVTGAAVVVSGAGWVTAAAGRGGEALVVAGAATIAVAAAVTALPVHTRVVAALAPVAAGATGLATGSLLNGIGPVPGLLVGLAAGVVTAALHALFGQFPASRRARPALAAALLPVLVAGVPVHLVGQLLGR